MRHPDFHSFARGKSIVPQLMEKPGKHSPDEQDPGIVSVPLVENLFLRRTLFICGWIFTGLAFLGAVLPLVPTTPFLLVAAACFYRSSGRFYHWIMYNRLFGHYLRDYRSGRGIPLHVKILALSFTWVSTLVSVIFFIPYLWLEILVIAISAAVTVHLVLIKTRRNEPFTGSE